MHSQLPSSLPYSYAHSPSLRLSLPPSSLHSRSSSKDGHSIEFTDDKSDFNGRTAADLSPFVVIDAWLKREKEKKKMQNKKEKEQEEGKESGEEGAIPSFFLISGWFDSTASCAMKLERCLRYV